MIRMARDAGAMTHFLLFITRVIKKGIPTTIAVHKKGTSTNRIGSFRELQLTALIAAPGISHKREKLVKSRGPGIILKMYKKK